eukprot:6422168-Pyramimonas_sp.AAC.1
MAASTSTTFFNIERPARKPCCMWDTAFSRRGSIRNLRALANSRLSVLTILSGLTSSAVVYATPAADTIGSFFGRNTMIASLNAEWPSASSGQAAPKAAAPASDSRICAASNNVFCANGPRRRQAAYGMPSGPGADRDVRSMARSMSLRTRQSSGRARRGRKAAAKPSGASKSPRIHRSISSGRSWRGAKTSPQCRRSMRATSAGSACTDPPTSSNAVTAAARPGASRRTRCRIEDRRRRETSGSNSGRAACNSS